MIASHRDADISFLKRGTRLRERLAKIEGFTLTGSHTGEMVAGPYTATVQLEPDSSLRVTLPAPVVVSWRDALAANAALDGNVRFAKQAGATSLVADTQIDGEIHLSDSFAAIRSGLLTAMQERHSRPKRPAADINIAELQQAIRGLSTEDNSIVQHAESWELLPRIAGEHVQVRLTVDGQTVRLHRVVLESVPEQGPGEAVAHEALLRNWNLRHARLAIADGRLVAETRLHAGLISSHWVSLATRAVATAARHVEITLRLLRDCPAVHELYASVFLQSSP